MKNVRQRDINFFCLSSEQGFGHARNIELRFTSLMNQILLLLDLQAIVRFHQSGSWAKTVSCQRRRRRRAFMLRFSFFPTELC
jgi:hypothetical protein